MDSGEKQRNAHKDRILKLSLIQKAMEGGEDIPELPKRKSKKRVIVRKIAPVPLIAKQKTQVIGGET